MEFIFFKLRRVWGIKGALYIIQILCRRYTFWSYPAGLTIADPPGKQKLEYRRVYSHHFHTSIAESIHTTPNSIQCPFNYEVSRAALRPTLAAHERGALPWAGAAWSVTARKASDTASNARGVAAGKMGRNSSEINQAIANLPAHPNHYNDFVDLAKKAARHNIPRGCQKEYIPGLSDDSSNLLKLYHEEYNKQIYIYYPARRHLTG